MNEFQEKWLKTQGGEDVKVQIAEHPDGSLRILADCDGHAHEHSLTLGPADQPLPPEYDLAAAQADLDRACQHCAEIAASKARLEFMKSQLK